MFASPTLFSYLLLSLSALYTSAAPAQPVGRGDIPSLGFSVTVGPIGSINLPERDRARATAIRSKAAALSHAQNRRGIVDVDVGLGDISEGVHIPDNNVNIQNAAVHYTASVGIGTPPTQYSLLIDTGSSNTWVGAGKPYQKTLSSEETPDKVSVKYGSGFFEGTEYLDRVTLSPSLVIHKQSIGVADKSQGLEGNDGILGVGPVGLTRGTLTDESKTIPTVTDNLYSQHQISKNSLGIFFAPYALENSMGTLTFGDVDPSHFEGAISYVPLTSTSPAADFWGIDQSTAYGSTPILSETAGIVDTGTTLVLLASDAFERYQQATGGITDPITGLLKITQAQYDALQPLKFTIGDRVLDLTPNAQIWPRKYNALIGGKAEDIYLIIANLGTSSGGGLDFILGYTFLERYYSVYDTGNGRVGFASTQHTNSEVN